MSAHQTVIVGAGQAGVQLAHSLRQNGYDGRICLVGDESGLPYQKPPLSKSYLEGKVGADSIRLRPDRFYSENAIDFLDAARATEINAIEKRVVLQGGRPLAYDHLVIAAGARNRPLPVEGATLAGVFYLRTLAEAAALREPLACAQDIVVIGGGFIGLEVAAVASARGANVRILEATDRLMGRVLTSDMSGFFASWHRGRGCELRLATRASRIVGDNGRATAVEIDDGQRLPCDLVIASVGVVPNIELAVNAKLSTADGIVVDRMLSTSAPTISAIGDCAFFPSTHANRQVRLESVQNAGDQARCVADRLTGKPRAYDSVPWFWSDQGQQKLQIVGMTAGCDRVVRRGDPASMAFSVFCFAGERLLGIESVNQPRDHMFGRRLLGSGRRITPDQAADLSFDLKELL